MSILQIVILERCRINQWKPIRTVESTEPLNILYHTANARIKSRLYDTFLRLINLHLTVMACYGYNLNRYDNSSYHSLKHIRDQNFDMRWTDSQPPEVSYRRNCHESRRNKDLTRKSASKLRKENADSISELTNIHHWHQDLNDTNPKLC